MSDWLSKITSKYHKTVTASDVIRMASVIRELMGVARLCKTTVDLTSPRWYKLAKSLENLSHDTKGLLEQ